MSACGNCGKEILEPNIGYQISPDGVCQCCKHDRRPIAHSKSEFKRLDALGANPFPPRDKRDAATRAVDKLVEQGLLDAFQRYNIAQVIRLEYEAEK